jgi:hypothetical protein
MQLVDKTQADGKECNSCGVHKPLEEYNKRSGNHSKDGHYHVCKMCHREKERDARYRRLFDITTEDYNQMFADQEGKCGCCGKHQIELNKRFAVDHDHNLPKGHPDRIRGLLCSNCNTSIGKLGDNIEGLEKALRYLNDHYSKD